MIKSLWAAVQGDPIFMRRINGWLAIIWVIMIPISFITNLASLWALVSGHWSAWQAARVEVKQDQQADGQP